MKRFIEEKARAIELATVVIEPLPTMTKSDAKRAESYPMAYERDRTPSATPRESIDSGLRRRLHLT